MKGPTGTDLSAVGTGHLRGIAPPAEEIVARQREVKALVELRVPFELDRHGIDDVERGAQILTGSRRRTQRGNSRLPKTEPSLVGYSAAAIEGIRKGTSNPIMTLPADVREYPVAIAQGLSKLRLVGINGPYSVVSEPMPALHWPRPATTVIRC